MNYRLFILCWLSLSLFSCQPIMKYLYGIKKPKYYKDSQIEQYFDNLGVEEDIHRVLNFDGSRIGAYKLSSIPRVELFNSNGDMVRFEATCSADYLDLTLLSLDSINSMPTTQLHIDSFVDVIYNIKNKGALELTENCPTFLVFGSKYIGKLNKLNALPWIESLKSREEFVQYFIVSGDINIK